jgi:hypothetical protein
MLKHFDQQQRMRINTMRRENKSFDELMASLEALERAVEGDLRKAFWNGMALASLCYTGALGLAMVIYFLVEGGPK